MAMSRGELRIYLGAAPGVGKTYAMLDEGRRRAERGTDVVVGLRRDPRPAAHRRAARRASRSCRGATIDLPRRHVHRDGRRRRAGPAARGRAGRRARAHQRARLAQREALAGRRGAARRRASTCISTVNIQHLESLNDVVEQITGVPQRETVPDEVVRARRPDRAGRHDPGGAAPADGARQRLRRRRRSTPRWRNYFRVGNLTALRELALLWARRPGRRRAPALPRRSTTSTGTWETRERVVVALTGGPEGETLIRRAARIAARASRRRPARRARHPLRRAGRRQPGARWPRSGRWSRPSAAPTTRSSATTCRDALLDFARAVNATQLVLGASRRSRLARAAHRPGHRRATTVRESGDIDVHIVTHDHDRPGRGAAARLAAASAPRRRLQRLRARRRCCRRC